MKIEDFDEDFKFEKKKIDFDEDFEFKKKRSSDTLFIIKIVSIGLIAFSFLFSFVFYHKIMPCRHLSLFLKASQDTT